VYAVGFAARVDISSARLYPWPKQNLQEIIDLVPQRMKTKQAVEKKWKALLWRGDLEALYHAIVKAITGKRPEAKR
jgi:hypothetical protein